VRADAILRLMAVDRDFPGDCERIIIVGAGGFGREVLQWACDAWPSDASKIAGFLSADDDKLDGYDTGLPILGSPATFEPLPGDRFVLAIGIPATRRRVTEAMLARGAKFLTLIHPTAIVFASAIIGVGSVICPYAIVSDAVRVGRFAILNYHSSLAHDAAVGEFAVLSPYATLGGGARVDDDGFLALHASVAPGRTVGCRSQVSSNSAVMWDVAQDSLAFGVPARVSQRFKKAP
jgi:sugar O-acyltransferase (sialic acid O-acetyltransferase NeuD family)